MVLNKDHKDIFQTNITQKEKTDRNSNKKGKYSKSILELMKKKKNMDIKAMRDKSENIEVIALVITRMREEKMKRNMERE